MALRSRTALTSVSQENTKKVLKNVGVTLVQPQTKRSALGEIGNKVNTVRGGEPIGKSSLLPKVQVAKKAVTKQKAAVKPPVEKVGEKPPIQVVRPIVKSEHEVNAKKDVPSEVQRVPEPAKVDEKLCEITEAFSSDLLPIDDVDERDKSNPLLVSIYTNDIYAYLRTLEKQYPIKKDFLAGQEVTPKMRCVLIDWLVEVHQQFHLMQETLYLTVAVIDRFLQVFKTIDRKRLQLVGVAAMYIASKYEEMYSPDISDFVYITDNAYTKTEILQMEMLIIKNLDFSFGRPLSLHFLRRYSKVANATPIHHAMAKYFLELCLVQYSMSHYPPSIIAAAALYLAFYVIGNDENEGKLIWTNSLVHYSTYTKEDLSDVVRAIAAVVISSEKSKYQSVRKKFTTTKNLKISLRPELQSPSLVAIAGTRQN